MTEAPAHGTVDLNAPGGPWDSHIDHDVFPVQVAAELDGCWESNFPIWGRIKEGCVGENMRKYFQVQPL